MAHPTTPQAATLPGFGRPSASMLGAVAIALLVLWIPVHLNLPLGRDQAIIARVAEAMLDGGWPYVDAWDHKGPAAYLLYAPAIAIFGQRENALLAMDLILLSALIPVYASLGRRLGSPLLGPLSVLVLIACVRDDYRTFSQPDVWIGYLAIAIAALLLSPRWGARRDALAVAGAAIGFAAMMKPVFVALLLVPLVALATLERDRRPRAAVAFVLAGMVAAIAAVAAPFVLAGHGPALWESYVAFNLDSHWERGWDSALDLGLRFAAVFLAPMLDLGMTLILVAAACGFAAIAREDRRMAMVLGATWVAAFLAVAAQRKAFPYQFMAIHGITALCAAVFVMRHVVALAAAGWHAADRGAMRKHALASGILMGGVLAAIHPHAGRAIELAMVGVGAMSEAERQRGLCYVDYCPPTLRALGALIRAETAADEPIFVWGFDSAVYLFADRPAASRFGFSYPLVGGTPQRREAMRIELIASLGRTPPRLIVVQTNDYIRVMSSRPSSTHLADFPELARLVETQYAPAHDFGDFRVYRRLH